MQVNGPEGQKLARKESLAVSLACMAIYWSIPGFKGTTIKLCVLSWMRNVCHWDSQVYQRVQAWHSLRLEKPRWVNNTMTCNDDSDAYIFLGARFDLISVILKVLCSSPKCHQCNHQNVVTRRPIKHCRLGFINKRDRLWNTCHRSFLYYKNYLLFFFFRSVFFPFRFQKVDFSFLSFFFFFVQFSPFFFLWQFLSLFLSFCIKKPQQLCS